MEKVSDTLGKMGLRPSGKASGPHSTEPEPACKVCLDYHFVYPIKPNGKTDYSRLVTCQCWLEQERRDRDANLLKLCQLPDATEHMTFDTIIKRPGIVEAVAAAELLAAEQDIKWLTLAGKVDLGKTHLAIAICREWIRRGVPARFEVVPTMLDRLRDTFNSGAEQTLQSMMDFLCTIPLLVLDDLGSEKPSTWGMEKLTTIANSRLLAGLSMVVTINCPLNEIPGDDEGRLASRLQREEWARVVVLDGVEFSKERRGKNEN